MKHAYLILAHHQEGALRNLISMLDDERNDIYVHIDKKARFDGANMHTEHSGLFVLHNRLDARWGDYSLVKAELLLFRTAYNNGDYSYFHLLSGVDFPIKSQDYIHSYCSAHAGTEYIGFAQNVTEDELKWRSQHYFLFSRHFPSKNLLPRFVRLLCLKLQDAVGYQRTRLSVKKGSQWCSVTKDFVEYLLSKETEIGRCFSHTYCPDEMVMQTLCWNSSFKERTCNLKDEFESCKRFIKWRDGELLPLSFSDIKDMFLSDCWFARKFDETNLSIQTQLREHYLK